MATRSFTRYCQNNNVDDHLDAKSEKIVPAVTNLRIHYENILREARQNASDGLVLKITERSAAEYNVQTRNAECRWLLNLLHDTYYFLPM